MRAFKITPGKGYSSCCEKEAKSVIDWLEISEVGDIITVEIIELSEKEYNQLPEYMGP